ncbi:glutathione S-transferase [Terasakiella sp. A23]|uniref:glutathione S-transferase n=1 Tax=Terasakiella sp. FCG-A23 TaxID=3080561 RepID=UPI0029531AD1|nr:glutathione S-transferase [Terasakiella sp. A23]MDV7340954.1 glutathione S-transferase [Terasakiella sp. A23]
MTYPILYSFRRCPYAMRARMALYVSGITCELREVVLRDKPAEMLALSPKATVPVLQLPDGTVLEESLDIMRWALVKNDPKGWLKADEDEIAQLIYQNDHVFKIHLDRYKYANRYDDADPLLEREKAEIVLQDLDQRISAHGHLCGYKPSLADYAIFPFIRQFCFADKAWFQSSPYQSLNRWLEGFLEEVVFLNVMPKFQQWHRGDEPLLFGAQV